MNLSQDEFEAVSRAQFTFFNKNGLFQASMNMYEFISPELESNEPAKIILKYNYFFISYELQKCHGKNTNLYWE